MDLKRIGVTSPEMLYAIVQDYLTRQQLAPQLRYNYPQRRPVEDVSPHRVKVKNDSGEIIPAFACMRITGVEDIGGQTCIKVEKPTSTDGEFLFNSQFAIAVPATGELGVGWAYRHGVVTMLGDEPTEPGAAFGPIVGSWEIEEGGDKFVVFGRHDFSERALVGRFSGGAGGNSRWGLVHAILGCGWYTIELGTLDGQTEASGSGPVCDPCANVTGAGTSGCELTLEYPTPRVTGSGTFITAYDPASTLVPLRVNTDCVVTRMPGNGPPASGSGSGSGASSTLWSVRGFQEHIVQYKERWDCCAPDGPPKLVGKTPIIFVGKECDEILCEECPASGSG